MPIIFYEYDYTKNLIDHGVEKITQKILNFVAMYYDYEGYSMTRIQREVENFCTKNNPYFNLIQSRMMIKRAMLHCNKNVMRFPNPITITKSELETINKLDDYKKEKILFCILVVARFFHEHSSKKNIDLNKRLNIDLYINHPIKDILELSGIKLTKKEWEELKYELCSQAYLTPTRISVNRFSVGFEDKNSEPVIVIDDYRNILGYYQEYCGEKMIQCETCGVLIAKNSNRHRLCRNCWNERQRELTLNRVIKFRNKNSVTV